MEGLPHALVCTHQPWCSTAQLSRLFTTALPCSAPHLQASKERDLLHSRLEALDAELERERGLHRRELARKAKEMAQVSEGCS